MKDYAEIFDRKADLLYEKLKIGENAFAEFSANFGKAAAFISVCDTEQRAYVFRASADNAHNAWEKAKKSAGEFVRGEKLNPVWVKGDIAKKGERKPFSEISDNPKVLYRRGIAFDDDFETALIEAEIAGNSLVSHKDGSIKLPALNKYLAFCEVRTLTQFPEDVILFDCASCFCDEKSEVYELYSEGEKCGRRVSSVFDRQTAQRVVCTSSDYLAMQVGLDGKFDYGYYSVSNKAIPGYNILRHAGSIWSLLTAYRLSGDKFVLEQAESAINYMIRNMVYKYPEKTSRENTLYVFDAELSEVKIGANALAVIALTEYMDIVGNNKYEKIVRELGNGITELFDERDGSFFHVLKYPSLAPRDKFRTVYYDGETLFALCRLYGLTKKHSYLKIACAAADRFIKKDYTKYSDHWTAYAFKELALYTHEEKYLNFALKNAFVNLEKIYRKHTQVCLELLGATFELLCTIKEQKLSCGYLKEFDEELFVKTIYQSADYILNLYGYPEYVMYFERPYGCLGSFFIRNDRCRTRIDDIQHLCSGFYLLYRNFEKLDAVRKDRQP